LAIFTHAIEVKRNRFFDQRLGFVDALSDCNAAGKVRVNFASMRTTARQQNNQGRAEQRNEDGTNAAEAVGEKSEHGG
jgi:hypothetical protein